jgi:hypothetical protein
VSSSFVQDAAVARAQKSRWEHGHLSTLIEELPGLLRATLARRDPALAVLAMDLMIPPVAFYFLLLTALLSGTILAAGFWPAFNAAAALAALAALSFALAIGLGWLRFGRELLSAGELLRLPLYALWKLPVYIAFFFGKRSGWVRTRRKSANASSLHPDPMGATTQPTLRHAAPATPDARRARTATLEP